MKSPFGKLEEIQWAIARSIPVHKTISCNDASEKTNYLACGKCKSCFRRNSAFIKINGEDPTEYYEKPNFEQID